MPFLHPVGDDRDPLSQGYFCSKAWALKDLHEDPDRVRHPLRRRLLGRPLPQGSRVRI